jgi:triacylglycerol esterase/lipase EstA (alpha/beta hydrolase family)
MVVSLAQLGQHLKRAFTSNVVKSSQEAKVVYPRRVKDTVVSLSIKPATLSGLDMPVTPHYIPPRAPIVLCHGLYGFDKIGPDALPLLQIQYWGGIENALAKLGANVIVTKVPSTGSIWDRAQTLHSILKSILDGQDVNFVAHSMVILGSEKTTIKLIIYK